jgi:hypothetical protein
VLVPSLPIPQVSIFLDNRPGSLFQAMSALDKNNIRIFALTIADAGDFGLVRFIAANPEKASKKLAEADFNLAKSKKNVEVIAIFASKENSLSKITKILGDGGINIEYAYLSAIQEGGKVALIIRPSDVAKAEEQLKANSVPVLSLEEIKKYFQ